MFDFRQVLAECNPQARPLSSFETLTFNLLDSRINPHQDDSRSHQVMILALVLLEISFENSYKSIL